MLDRKTLLSWEFLALLLTNVAAWALTMADSGVGHNSAVYWTAGSAGLYALVRGLAKVNHDSKDWWQTPEFLLAILAAIITTVAALASTINEHTYGILMAALLGLSALGNGVRKVPIIQADPSDPPTTYPPDYGDNALDPEGLAGPDDVA